MNHAKNILADAPAALIYCRVSDRKQKTQGGGLQSQEQRCRKYAEERGYAVEMVFPDDITGEGDFMKRPGMRAMLAYIEASPRNPSSLYSMISNALRVIHSSIGRCAASWPNAGQASNPPTSNLKTRPKASSLKP